MKNNFFNQAARFRLVRGRGGGEEVSRELSLHNAWIER